MSISRTVRLFLPCKRCGSLFDSGRVMTRKDFEKGDLRGTTHTCRHCASAAKYSKKDYIARDVA